MLTDVEPDTKPDSGSDQPTLKVAGLAFLGSIGIVVLVFGTSLLMLRSSTTLQHHLTDVLASAGLISSLAILGLFYCIIRLKHIPASAIGISKPTRRLWHVLWQIPAAIVLCVFVQRIVVALGVTSYLLNRTVFYHYLHHLR